MAYDCINGWEDIIGRMLDSGTIDRAAFDAVADDAAEVADLALTALGALQVKANVIQGRHEAARAMLAALEDVIRREDEGESTSTGDLAAITAAIAQAKAAGITTERE